MKRFNLIIEARDKEVFGILINKPNLTNYLKVLERVKSLLIANNKKFYKLIISMQKRREKLI